MDISGIGANLYGVDGCTQIVHLAKGMKKINLANNNLTALGFQGLCDVLNCISPSAIQIDLGNNALSLFNEEQLKQIICAIPSTVRQIILDLNGLSDELIQCLMQHRKAMKNFETKLLDSPDTR